MIVLLAKGSCSGVGKPLREGPYGPKSSLFPFLGNLLKANQSSGPGFEPRSSDLPVQASSLPIPGPCLVSDVPRTSRGSRLLWMRLWHSPISHAQVHGTLTRTSGISLKMSGHVGITRHEGRSAGKIFSLWNQGGRRSGGTLPSSCPCCFVATSPQPRCWSSGSLTREWGYQPCLQPIRTTLRAPVTWPGTLWGVLKGPNNFLHFLRLRFRVHPGTRSVLGLTGQYWCHAGM